jgi:hypothetical protein
MLGLDVSSEPLRLATLAYQAVPFNPSWTKRGVTRQPFLEFFTR